MSDQRDQTLETVFFGQEQATLAQRELLRVGVEQLNGISTDRLKCPVCLGPLVWCAIRNDAQLTFDELGTVTGVTDDVDAHTGDAKCAADCQVSVKGQARVRHMVNLMRLAPKSSASHPGLLSVLRLRQFVQFVVANNELGRDYQETELFEQLDHVQRVLAAVTGTPCSERMPESQTRVLFFVPGRVTPQRWRSGHWDGNARAPRWWDDVTEVGDEPVLYPADQVTHWMPLPGMPT